MYNVEIKIGKDIPLIPDKIKKASNQTLREAIVFMEGVGVKTTPIRTGFLRKSFFNEVKDFEANFFNKAFYAPYVNFWTSRQKANPFMERIKEEVEKQLPIFLYNNLKKEWLIK